MELTWQNTYLLGWWYNGIHLTSWLGKGKWVDVVVLNATNEDMSHIMWNRPLHNNFQLLQVPEGINPHSYAKQMNGIYAFGWKIETGINRPSPRPLIDEWEWWKLMKGLQ